MAHSWWLQPTQSARHTTSQFSRKRQFLITIIPFKQNILPRDLYPPRFPHIILNTYAMSRQPDRHQLTISSSRMP